MSDETIGVRHKHDWGISSEWYEGVEDREAPQIPLSLFVRYTEADDRLEEIKQEIRGIVGF